MSVEVPPHDNDKLMAASVLANLKIYKAIVTDISGVSNSDCEAHWLCAIDYLSIVKETLKSDEKTYHSFLAVLMNAMEDIIELIDSKREFVTRCAESYFQGHERLILDLHEFFVPKDDDVSMEEEEEEEEQTPKQTSPPLQGPLEQKKKEREQKIAPFLWKVQHRLQHSDQTACARIRVALIETLIDMTMSVEQAKMELSPLLQHHNDLWREFERFLPEEYVAGSSSAAPANHPQ